MTFDQALKILGIEEYKSRIFHSNSRGELFHVYQYFTLAKVIKDDPEGSIWFASWFKYVVKTAEATWNRPESVFQHITTILRQHIKEQENELH